MSKEQELRTCHDCGAKPGELHTFGCDVERCRLCGFQAISCDCIYHLAGMDVGTMEKDHPDIYSKGPTVKMVMAMQKEIDKYGGRLPWTGIWPGVLECREFGWYAKMVPGLTGWHSCPADDPEAKEDLNRLYKEARWSREQGRFLLK